MDLPLEILNKISGYYPSPELTATHVCNIPLAVYKFKIEKIVGNLLIAHRLDQYRYIPKERFAIMINLENQIIY